MPFPPVHRCAIAAAVLALAPVLGAAATPAETASPWVESYNSRTRLIAGTDGGKIYAGVVIEMAEGWKTYWRHPGDSGGVPPDFDWAKSDNLQSAVVGYPAPRRLEDPAGDAVGYTGRVVFPARIVAANPDRPVQLALKLEYGICKDICVPVEVLLRLDLPANMATELPARLSAAIDQVPRTATAHRAKDPTVVRSAVHLVGDKPRLEVEVEYAGGGAGADAFIEAPDGIYVPQPKPKGSGQGARRLFEVDLTTGVDPQDLRGKQLTLTLVSAAGQSQVPWRID